MVSIEIFNDLYAKYDIALDTLVEITEIANEMSKCCLLMVEIVKDAMEQINSITAGSELPSAP